MPSKQRGEEPEINHQEYPGRTFEYESKEQVLTNWAQYNQAQIYEMANYLDNIRDLVAEAYKRITKTLLLQTYIESSNRVAEGLLLLFREKLDISRLFHRPYVMD
jgi:hypothetical protein